MDASGWTINEDWYFWVNLYAIFVLLILAADSMIIWDTCSQCIRSIAQFDLSQTECGVLSHSLAPRDVPPRSQTLRLSNRHL